MMQNVELWLEVLVAILLAITVGYCFILNRRLAALRGAQDEMVQLTADFSEAMRMAQAGISDLRKAGDDIGEELQHRVNQARALSDELRVMTQSGEDLANRLEVGLVGKSGAGAGGSGNNEAGNGPGSGGGASESELERELKGAIRRTR